jgi:hypothetical protein
MKWLWKRLGQLAAMDVAREEMLMKLGAARSKAPAAWRLVDIDMAQQSATFTFSLNRARPGAAMAILRSVGRRGGGLQNPQG